MYKAILFSPDGEWVTDYEAETIHDVWEQVNDGGSRWVFYPFPFVVKDQGNCFSVEHGRIIDTPDASFCPNLKGKSIKSAQQFIKENGEELLRNYL